MKKPVFAMLLGGFLGIFDGLSALISAPQELPNIVGIVIGSTFKGVIAGAIIGLVAQKTQLRPTRMTAIMRASEGWLSSTGVFKEGADQQLAPDTHMKLGPQRTDGEKACLTSTGEPSRSLTIGIPFSVDP